MTIVKIAVDEMAVVEMAMDEMVVDEMVLPLTKGFCQPGISSTAFWWLAKLT